MGCLQTAAEGPKGTRARLTGPRGWVVNSSPSWQLTAALVGAVGGTLLAIADDVGGNIV